MYRQIITIYTPACCGTGIILSQKHTHEIKASYSMVILKTLRFHSNEMDHCMPYFAI